MGNRDEHKREFVMLAGKYDPEKAFSGCRSCKKDGKRDCTDVIGWYMSEKLDGMRCLWDGGISRGKPVIDVPYANWNDKDSHLIATGLWSRGGKVVHAPESWLDTFPIDKMLDGELYSPKLSLQDIVSITRAYDKEEEWEKIKYYIFDSPTPRQFLKAGRIHIRDWEAELPDMFSFNIRVFDLEDPYTFHDFVTDWSAYYGLPRNGIPVWDHVQVLEQIRCQSIDHLEAYLEKIVSKGGEGVMLRRPESVWHPRRARHDLVKYKRFYDAEAEVIGITFGKETKKDSRLRGKLGALIVRELDTGHIFQLAGLKDGERGLHSLAGPADTAYAPHEVAAQFAYDHPNNSVIFDPTLSVELAEKIPDLNILPEHHWMQSDTFKKDDVVTFKYWDRTKDGVPKFAQFWRERTYE